LDYLTTHTSLSPIRHGFAPGFVNYKKGCTRLAGASDKVYQLLAHGRWFSPGTPASSTTKTGRHDIAEILLKVALNTIKSNLMVLGQFSYYLRTIRATVSRLLRTACVFVGRRNLFNLFYMIYCCRETNHFSI
jgi:hypothetical protein